MLETPLQGRLRVAIIVYCELLSESHRHRLHPVERLEVASNEDLEQAKRKIATFRSGQVPNKPSLIVKMTLMPSSIST